MKKRHLYLLAEIVTPLALLAVLAIWTEGADNFFLPPISDVLREFNDNWIFERVGTDVLPSLIRLFAGFSVASVFGITAGLIVGLSRTVADYITPIMSFLRATPPTAMVPFGIVVLGIGDSMKISIIALVCTFPVLLSTIDGVRAVDPILVDTSRTYRVSTARRVSHVVLPAALPQIYAGLRTALSLGLILMVVTELVASTNGLGFFVLQAQRQFSIPQMWSGILLLGILGYVLNGLVLLTERRVLGWYHNARSRARA